jgi:hypothetical protein
MLSEASNPEPKQLHTFSLILVHNQTLVQPERRPHAEIRKEGALRAHLKFVCMATCLENTGELRMHWNGTAQILMTIARPLLQWLNRWIRAITVHHRRFMTAYRAMCNLRFTCRTAVPPTIPHSSQFTGTETTAL